ncbi:ATP-binding protein, partial [Staphylococcus pseudintermedius]|nr:ATP-binding protein [Staphylococcus pseudintermedius]
ELDDYYKYTVQIEKINNKMRKFRHDYTNILLTMSEYLREDDLNLLNRVTKTKEKQKQLKVNTIIYTNVDK